MLSLPDELMENLEPVPWSGCWIWMGPTDGRGYPVVSGGFTIRRGHRLAYAIAHGVPPSDDIYVCHHCDNPSCMNPGHLFLGSHADNLRDARHKNRMAQKLKGEAMAKALLMVASSRYRHDEIAREVGVQPRAIANLVRRIEQYKGEKIKLHGKLDNP